MTRKFAVAAAFAALLPVSAVASEWSDACAELYMKRNHLYHQKGFCFTRRTAIIAFPNNPRTCDPTMTVRDIPLSANEKRYIDSIVAAERELGCPRLP
jgi:hypothetical protein